MRPFDGIKVIEMAGLAPSPYCGMFCAMGILLAFFERTRSGKGQVIDSAMMDGAENLSVMFHGLLAHNLMSLDIGTNPLVGVPQPAPAPRLSRTPGKANEVKGPRGANTEEIILDLGYPDPQIRAFFKADVIEQSQNKKAVIIKSFQPTQYRIRHKTRLGW